MSAASNKKKRPSGRVSLDKGGKKICVFCEDPTTKADLHGKLLSSKSGISAHYFCLLFSSGLCQNGKSEKQGLLGFLPEDIGREVRRGVRLRCSYCKMTGATVGCVKRNCKTMYHFACGRTNGVLFQFFNTFSSYCLSHRPQQDVAASKDGSAVCSICMCPCIAAPTADTIRAPCCKKDWYHRECVQHHATSAGLHYFKCPLCNNKDQFQQEMLTYGIYIPDQDASWETEPHAFQDLLERYRQCDAKVCRCVEGRKYDKDGSKWEIILCDFCGSRGSHVGCSYLIKEGRVNICPECKDIDTRTGGKLLHKSPKGKPIPKRNLEMSPEKGKNNYPGPSGKLRKTGLPQTFVSSPDGKTHPLSPSWSSPQKHDGPESKSKGAKKRARSSGGSRDDKTAKRRRKTGPTNNDDYFQDTVPLSKLIQQLKSSNSVENSGSQKSLDANRLKQADPKNGTGRSTKINKASANDKAQTTLTGWLKLGSSTSHKSSTTKDLLTKSKIPNIFSKQAPAKRPSIIEWKGKQLLIRSPRVQLEKVSDSQKHKSKKLIVFKPRKLDLNVDETIPYRTSDNKLPVRVQSPITRKLREPGDELTTVKSGNALLASLDCDFRVTRKMVSATEVIRYTYSDDENSPASGEEHGATVVKPDSHTSAVPDAMSDSPVKNSRNYILKLVLNVQEKIKNAKLSLGDVSGTDGTSVDDSPSKNLRNSKRKIQSTIDATVKPSRPSLKDSPVKVPTSRDNYLKNSTAEVADRGSESNTENTVRTPRDQGVTDHRNIDSPAKNLRNSKKLQPSIPDSMKNDTTNMFDKFVKSEPKSPTDTSAVQTYTYESNTTPKHSGRKHRNILEKNTPVSQTKQENICSTVLRSSANKATAVPSPTSDTPASLCYPATETAARSVLPHAKVALDLDTDSPTTAKVKTLKRLIGKYPQKMSAKSLKVRQTKPSDGFTAIKETRPKHTAQDLDSHETGIFTQQLHTGRTSPTQTNLIGITAPKNNNPVRERLLKYTMNKIKYSIPATTVLENSHSAVETRTKEPGMDTSKLSNNEPCRSSKFKLSLSKGRLIVEEQLSRSVSGSPDPSPNSRVLRNTGSHEESWSPRHHSPARKTCKSLSPSYTRIGQKSEASPSLVVNTKSSQMTLDNGAIHIRSRPSSPENNQVVAENINNKIVHPAERKTKGSISPKKSAVSDKSLMAQYYAMTSPDQKVAETRIDADDIVDLAELMDDVC